MLFVWRFITWGIDTVVKKKLEQLLLGFCLCTVPIFIGGVVAVGIIFLFPFLTFSETDPLSTITESIILPLVGFGGVTFLFLWLTDRDIDYLGIRVPNKRDWLWIFFVTPVFVGFIVATTWVGEQVGISPPGHQLIEIVGSDPVLFAVFVATFILFTGPFEELLYRGVVQNFLAEEFSDIGAILLTSAIFAALHIPAFPDATVVGVMFVTTQLFILSSIFGWVYFHRDNLVTVMIIHGLYNALILYTYTML